MQTMAFFPDSPRSRYRHKQLPLSFYVTNCAPLADDRGPAAAVLRRRRPGRLQQRRLWRLRLRRPVGGVRVRRPPDAVAARPGEGPAANGGSGAARCQIERKFFRDAIVKCHNECNG